MQVAFPELGNCVSNYDTLVAFSLQYVPVYIYMFVCIWKQISS